MFAFVALFIMLDHVERISDGSSNLRVWCILLIRNIMKYVYIKMTLLPHDVLSPFHKHTTFTF